MQTSVEMFKKEVEDGEKRFDKLEFRDLLNEF